MNNLYGPKFIEKQRSSGYRSTIHAMAEIVDNSVDAAATKIDIVIKQKEKTTGTRKSLSIDEIFFLDNGKGMSYENINKCLTFSEGEGKSKNRIGAFGVGLPNSSISVCRRVEVYSKDKNGTWNYVFLDLDDQITREEPGYNQAIEQTPSFDKAIKISTDCRTIVRWMKIDLIETSNIAVFSNRAQKYLGRIYRYKLNNGLLITLSSFIHGNSEITKSTKSIIPYDPMFIMENKNYMTEIIWKAATIQDPKGKHPLYGDHEEFQSVNYYKKFIEGCIENETNKAIFQKMDDYWDQPYTIKVGDKTHEWRIRASFAYRDIRTPGIQAGGNTDLGRELGKKMNGNRNDRIESANIFFMRGEREIDCGNYGLYKVTDETQRFWTIEIHFSQDLDDLMGVSNTKQSVGFKPITKEELENADNHEDLSLGLARDILWCQMTETISRAIKAMMKHISQYAKEWRQKELSMINEKDGSKSSIPTAESAVIEVIPKGDAWSHEQKSEISKFFKAKFMHLKITDIEAQVEKFSRGLSKTLVLYAANESGHLFELVEKKGIKITIINTNHIYYTNILEPLKSNNKLKEFAISIEMLISSCAYEMELLIIGDSHKYEQPLNKYLLLLSSRLNEFITDGQIKINTQHWENLAVDFQIDNEE